MRIRFSMAAPAAVAVALGAQAQPAPSAPPAAATAAAPSADTLALARQVALKGDFLGMIQSAAGLESEGVVKSLGDMTADEHAKAAAITRVKIAETLDKLADAMAPAYASMFTPEQLRQIDAFQSSPTGQLYARSLLGALTAMQKAEKDIDLKREMKDAACAQIGKGCEARPATPPSPPQKDRE